MFPATVYDPETLGLLNRVFDEAWIDTQAMLGAAPLDAAAMRLALAKRIMAAANDGERNPGRLKLRALGAVNA